MGVEWMEVGRTDQVKRIFDGSRNVVMEERRNQAS
jgi:hypothetical protein